MPGGWLMWLLEQYGINHEVVKAQDFEGDLNARYDVILLPSGTSKTRIINGLDRERNDPAEWSWAYGVGEAGWTKLKTFVAERRHAAGDWLGRGDRHRTAGPAD